MTYRILPAVLGLTLAGCQVMIPPGPDQPRTPIEVIEMGREAPETRDEQPAPTPDRVPRRVAFSAEEYAALAKTGTATISGRLTLDTAAGTVIGADETIAVAPVTSYSAEAAEQALAGRAVERADPRAREYTHTTRSDANGYFRLTGLPSGDFYVSGSTVDPVSGRRRIIIRQVSLADGQHREVDLSR